eukprot:gene25310-31753_t
MGGILPLETRAQDYVYNIHNIPFEDMMDVSFIFEKQAAGEEVIVPEAVFEAWREVVEGYHVIIIGDTDIVSSLTIPPWMLPDYEVYSRKDLIKTFLDLNLEDTGPMREVKNIKEKLQQAADSSANAAKTDNPSPHTEVRSLTGVDLLDNIFDYIGLHSFAAWVSDREYIYIVDNTCVPMGPTVRHSKLGTVSGSRNIHDVPNAGIDSDAVSGRSTMPSRSGRRFDGKVRTDTHSRHTVLEKHIANLRTGSVPHYFNTLGDPYQPGNDFSHSYPFQLRSGVSTALSHGVFIGDKHYDPLTRLVKIPSDHPQHNTGLHADTDSDGDASIYKIDQDRTDTIPYGQLFSMSRSNVAFNRQSLGSALLFFGSSGRLTKTSYEDIVFSNYHDIITGWILKIVMDECHYGAKSGAPYSVKSFVKNSGGKMSSSGGGMITPEVKQADSASTQSAAANPTASASQITPSKTSEPSTPTPTSGKTNDHSEFHHTKISTELLYDVKSNFTFLSDTSIYDFFSTYKLNKTTLSYLNNPDCGGRNMRVECVYTELATALDQSPLGAQYSYFKLLSAFMKLWVVMWQTRHSFMGTIFPHASRSSMSPKIDKEVPKCAMITITHNEEKLFPVWIRYHMRHFHPSDIYVLDHITTDNSTHPSKIPRGVNVMHLEGNRYTMPVLFRSQVIKVYQDRLLRSGYKCVLFSDTDEIVIPHPTVYPKGLGDYLTKFAADTSREYHRVTAWELGHMSWGNGSKSSQEPPLDWSRSVLAQRRFFAHDTVYNKPLLTKMPMTYRPGFHRVYHIKLDRNIPTDTDLIMFHLRSMDQTFCLHREVEKYNMTKTMEQAEINAGFASHWNAYERDKKTGELCKYAIGCHLGVLTKQTKLWDNTGVFPML